MSVVNNSLSDVLVDVSGTRKFGIEFNDVTLWYVHIDLGPIGLEIDKLMTDDPR